MVALNRTTGITFPMPDGRKVLIEGNAYVERGVAARGRVRADAGERRRLGIH